MGWYFSEYDRKILVNKLTAPTEDYKVLKHWSTDWGKRLWVACELQKDTGVILYLTRKHRGQWGYKTIDESMGPCYYDCPLEALELTKGFGGYSDTWRAKVKEYHALRVLRKEG